MVEEFLWHIWKFRLFDNEDLSTTQGAPVQILKTGDHNMDSGPDFFNARIKIDNTTWAGNVEIHVNASDWKKHSHQKDKAFDNIILHVVYEADVELFRENGEPIPTLELKNRIPKDIYGKYLQFKSSKDWIPCQKQVNSVDKMALNNWLDRLLVERLERKSNTIRELLKLNKNDWEESFYQMMARSFGFKTNGEPFELLARSLPNTFLSKHKDSLLQVEAMLFGQAGFLDKSHIDKYAQRLQNEYVFLKQKFKLQPIRNHLWKFLRLRPGNFPTIRIAQFAQLIHTSSHLFSKVLEAETVSSLKKLMNVDTSEYWQTHYRFNKPSTKKIKALGENASDVIIINTIVPFLFVYGKERGEEQYCERTLSFLEKIEPENNSIIARWKSIGVTSKNSYETQALLQLKNEYCSKKKCLNCGVGVNLLKR